MIQGWQRFWDSGDASAECLGPWRTKRVKLPLISGDDKKLMPFAGESSSDACRMSG